MMRRSEHDRDLRQHTGLRLATVAGTVALVAAALVAAPTARAQEQPARSNAADHERR